MTTTTKPTDVDAEVQRRIAEKIQREEAERMERIRAEVLAEQQQQRKAEERAARIEDIRKRLPVELDRAPLEEAKAALAAALESYMATCAAYDAKHRELWNDLNDVAASGPLPRGIAASHVYGGMISTDTRDYRKSRVQFTLSTLAAETFRKHYPREEFDLGRPQD